MITNMKDSYDLLKEAYGYLIEEQQRLQNENKEIFGTVLVKMALGIERDKREEALNDILVIRNRYMKDINKVIEVIEDIMKDEVEEVEDYGFGPITLHKW